MAKVVSSSSKRPRGARWLSPAASVSSRNQTQTEQALADLQRAIAGSALPTPLVRERFATEITTDVLRSTVLPVPVRHGITASVMALIEDELGPLYAMPEMPVRDDHLAAYEVRALVRLRLGYFDHEAERLSTWRRALVATFRNVLRIFPERRPTGSTLTITAPLFTLFADPVGAIDDITRGLSKLAVEPNDPTIRPGIRLGGAVIANVLAASRLTFEEAQKRPYRLVWPSEAKVSPAELPATYLAGTPFEALLQTPVEIPIPSDLRTEHAIITATIGHGKTQLMQSIILGDLGDGAQPGIVVIDSQGDAIHTLSRLQRFDPAISDRLVILDPTDIQPPALNIFHWDRDFSATLCGRDREEYLAGVIELFHFIAGGLLGAELTARMSVVFRFISQLLVEIPNATIHDLIALLQDPSPYMQYIGSLPPTTQAFIEQLFDERSQYRQTRQHLLQRLYHVISNPAFERMFAHPKNKFDMRAALNDGKVVLINTAKAQLKAEWSAIFGRYFVALIMQAAFARAFIPPQQRRLALIHIDECHEYLDENVEQLLIQGRKYAIALHLYHQHMKQMQEKGLRETALSIPAIRYTGSLNDADAQLLAKETNTTPDFLKAVRKTNRGTEWSVYVRNLTPTAVRFAVPFLEVERQPKMSGAAYQRLLERNRQLVGAPRRPGGPTSASSRRPPNNDGDAY